MTEGMRTRGWGAISIQCESSKHSWAWFEMSIGRIDGLTVRAIIPLVVLFPLHIETGLVVMVHKYHLTRLVDGSRSSDGDS